MAEVNASGEGAWDSGGLREGREWVHGGPGSPDPGKRQRERSSGRRSLGAGRRPGGVGAPAGNHGGGGEARRTAAVARGGEAGSRRMEARGSSAGRR